MEYIKGITFAPFAPKHCLATEDAFESMREMKRRTNANFVILAPAGIQDTPESEEIDYTSDATMGDDELIAMIQYAKCLGLRVALKPTVNCKNGVWRAHIHFFDIDVPCEPKWCNWFAAYTKFQLHYAKIAEKTGCEMFITGCEMVMTEHREAEWRQLLQDVRGVYRGLVSYNTDKYQEDHVKWWDAVDVISSSGYYPATDWEKELNRIACVVEKYDKPFFFAEAGCMSKTGSAMVPNDWTIDGTLCLEEQVKLYEAMFSSCSKRSWVCGFGLWSWHYKLNSIEEAREDAGYDLYGKPVERVVKAYYEI